VNGDVFYAMVMFFMRQRVLCQCCLSGADDEDGSRSGLFSAKRRKDGMAYSMMINLA
jgi:hypothetical protein